MRTTINMEKIIISGLRKELGRRADRLKVLLQCTINELEEVGTIDFKSFLNELNKAKLEVQEVEEELCERANKLEEDSIKEG